MKTKAVRLYGKNDLRLEEFELPAIREDEILMEVVSDSICMSTYKAVIQGTDHKRVPGNISEEPVIIGHEFCGRILEIGEKWKTLAKPGEKCAVQPAINYKGRLDAPGYSYRYCGGAATRIILPNELMEMGCLLPYGGQSFFKGSLAEPMSCVIRGFRENYHIDHRKGTHIMGIKEGGRALILAGAGPMGLGAVDYALGSDRTPGLLAVADIDQDRLDRAAGLFPSGKIPGKTRLCFSNTAPMEDPADELMKLSDNQGWDDILVMAPVPALITLADKLLAKDGCMNFFAGPTRRDFSAPVNFYNIHYSGTHIIGSAGGNTEDMKEALDMMQTGRSNPSSMISHVGGLDATAGATLHLPEIPGGKKLIYTGIDMELTPLEGFRQKAAENPLYGEIADAIDAAGGIWSDKAEELLLGERI